MSWLSSRLAATQANRWSKSVNPFMTAEKSESTLPVGNQNPIGVRISDRKDSYEDVHSYSTIFGLDWARRKSVEELKQEQALIENVRLLVEEERDRQMEFDRTYRMNY
ncbi:hypothetical protein COOONC_07898 [Cooperia oncophora]